MERAAIFSFEQINSRLYKHVFGIEEALVNLFADSLQLTINLSYLLRCRLLH